MILKVGGWSESAFTFPIRLIASASNSSCFSCGLSSLPPTSPTRLLRLLFYFHCTAMRRTSSATSLLFLASALRLPGLPLPLPKLPDTTRQAFNSLLQDIVPSHRAPRTFLLPISHRQSRFPPPSWALRAYSEFLRLLRNSAHEFQIAHFGAGGAAAVAGVT